MQQARHWCGLLEVLIKRADSDVRAACMAPIGQERSNPSVADELVKLVELRDRGILTATEFAHQKARLLAQEA